MWAKIQKQVYSLIASVLLVSCVSTSEGGGLDLVALHNHLHPASIAFSDAAVVIEPNDPELASKIRELEQVVKVMDAIVESYLSGGTDELSTLDAIDKFLIETQPLLSQYTDNPNVQLALIAVRQILSQIRIGIQQ